MNEPNIKTLTEERNDGIREGVYANNHHEVNWELYDEDYSDEDHAI